MAETVPPRPPRVEPPRAEGLDVVKRALVGTPMPSHAMKETLLRKTLALPIYPELTDEMLQAVVGRISDFYDKH